MQSFVFDTDAQGADYVVQSICTLLLQKPDALLCLAAGHSSLPVFARLLAAQQSGAADFSHARFVGLDEWLDVDPSCLGACGNFLRRELFTPLGLAESQLCLFDSLTQNSTAECARIEHHIETCGGIDYLLLGMGMNGHLALNEPGDSFANGAHVAPLSQITKDVAPKYFPAGAPVPQNGITLGIRNLLAARKIQLTLFGTHKQQVTQTLLHSEVSEAFPASVLHTCAHAELVADRSALPA